MTLYSVYVFVLLVCFLFMLYVPLFCYTLRPFYVVRSAIYINYMSYNTNYKDGINTYASKEI